MDPPESIAGGGFDYVLVAAVDYIAAGMLEKKILDLGIEKNRILKVTVPENREALLMQFLAAGKENTYA